MKLEPVEDWITAVAILHMKPSPIINLDAAKDSSRCFLIEGVGPKAAEAGYEVGQIVVAKSVYDLRFYNGAFHRVTFVKDEIIQRVLDARLEEFVLLDGETTADKIELGAPIGTPSEEAAAE